MKIKLIPILLLTILALTACAAPNSKVPRDRETVTNQPHLPPPDFPVSEAPTDVRYCGGMIRSETPECQPDEFCRRTIGDMCGAADAPGQCTIVPELCTQDYRPVCGCNGKTYGNECMANAQGISANYAGECK